MAHELAHIKNRDTLTMTAAASFGGAISMVAQYLQFGAIFGRGSGSRFGWLGFIFAAVVAPLSAMLVQMAISRSREYQADRMGAMICGEPRWLMSALVKIDEAVKRIKNKTADAHRSSAHLFIVNPLTEQPATACSPRTRTCRTASRNSKNSPSKWRPDASPRSTGPERDGALFPEPATRHEQARPRREPREAGRSGTPPRSVCASMPSLIRHVARSMRPSPRLTRLICRTSPGGTAPLPVDRDVVAAPSRPTRNPGRWLSRQAAVGRHRAHVAILATRAAQFCPLETPPHAAISLAVDLARIDHTARRFDKLINAVLRRVAKEGKRHSRARWCSSIARLALVALGCDLWRRRRHGDGRGVSDGSRRSI